MKTLLILVVISTLLLSGCNKTNLQSPATVNMVTPAENTPSAEARTKTSILTAHPWMYKGYYFHYIDQNHKGDPQYVRGSSSNIIDLDDTRITYRKNGTFLEVDGGYNYPGTWKFTDAADTVLVMTYEWGTDVNTIVKLTINHLNYKKPIGSYSHNNFAYSELIPAN